MRAIAPHRAWIVTLMLPCLSPLMAGQLGPLTYVTHPTSVTIADCDEAATGVIEIPDLIEGKPVTAIGDDAFEFCFEVTGVTLPSGIASIGNFAFNSCAGLTAITLPGGLTSIGSSAFQACSGLETIMIPASVTSIGSAALSGCGGLVSITVDPLNAHYGSAAGILFDKAQTTVIQCPPAKSGTVVIPASVTSIGALAFDSCPLLTGVTFPDGLATLGASAFYGCTGLTSLELPAGVTSIGTWAFHSCAGLASVTFTGHAPTLGVEVFDFAAETFTIYYQAGSAGFTSPTWMGYPATMIGEPSPIAQWLALHGLPASTDMESDPDGDGVSFLLAYAFNLNPHLNLSGSLPKPVLASNQLSLTYHAGSDGVTYTVQSCTDLQDWSTEAVTLSAPDANQFRTATVPVSGPRRFMRIRITGE